ncbi:alpha-glucan family phosphorylase [Allostreptomyces psammosilenae]|uniref:glycogen phosphorylase n=1 Tax=Allostreptomyces psammosilenae TaxID=1892865 RepID=A0A852ZZ61_9ACTN|nr:alpha-glucan family phosphorylase [Allostreptomyces psammosilenae]NYI06510.1 starch phosphorylase [Allostreptomyces psammosilenae]
MKAIRRFTVRTVLPGPLQPLGELARNLRWSWHPETRELFQSVDPEVWEATGGDPVRLLGAVPAERLADLASDRRFLRRLGAAAEELRDYLTGPRWYQTVQPAPDGDAAADRLPDAIAYFSPEFGITAALPQYSGGLGILAGDHLKAASDLGVPVIGVGLLYRHGYFRQTLSRDGWQQEHYPVLDPNELPVTVLRDEHGDPATVVVDLPGDRRLHARVRVAHVGRVPLLLLDSDIEENGATERDVTDRLYGGGSEHRLLQEMLLGIGGVRAVRRYCALTGHPEPEVFHTNEGHAGFLGLERIRELTEDRGLDFDAALEAVRAGTVFTTHTPVPAGIDRFDRDLIARHFGGDNALADGMPIERVLELGAETWPDGSPQLFNMAAMGLRLAQRANGVSRLHGSVSRQMFAGLWPGFDAAEVPITSITNGVHAPTWMAPEVGALGARELGQQRLEDAMVVGGHTRWDAVDDIPAETIWELRRTLRGRLVEEVRRRLRESWRQRGAGEAELGWTDTALDPDVLTIGFARRVPSYKRLTLMLRNPRRLQRLLLHPERPVQIVIAGKAHPADEGGKRLIQELVRFSDDPAVRHRIVFLPDYDMSLAQHLYWGCDVWLNNPLRPLEACGTSGMKAALNGALNLSILDGWWDEWYDGENGWAIPTSQGVGADGHPNTEYRDDVEATALYELVENQVTARFYARDPDGLPLRWIEMVRHTLATLGPKVLAARMVREYVTELYAPAARTQRALSAAGPDGDAYRAAVELAAWKARVRQAWPGVRVDHVETTGLGSTAELGSTLNVRVRVDLGELGPGDVDVQVMAGRVDSADRITEAVTTSLKPADRSDLEGRLLYEGPLTLDRTGAFGYTVRVLPSHPLLGSPTELGLVATPDDSVHVDDGDLR